MRTREFILLVFILDLLILNCTILGVDYERVQQYFVWDSLKNNTLFWVFNATWIVNYLIFIDDFKPYKESIWKLINNMGKRLTAFLALFSLVVFYLEIGQFFFDKGIIMKIIFIFFILKIVQSVIIHYLFSWYLISGKSPIILVGGYKNQMEVMNYFHQRSYLGFNVLGILTDDKEYLNRKEVLGSIDDFESVYQENPFNDAIISLPLYEKKKITDLITLSEKNGVRPRLIPNWGAFSKKKFISKSIEGDIPVLDIRKVPLYDYPKRFVKRAFDLIFSSIGLIVLSPVLLIVAILIKLDSPGAIFYRPTRLGVNGRPFKVYKFRSMIESDDANHGTKSTVKNDSRITRIGKFLRKSNLDELPQLINVFMNEMSIVGPRPHRVFLNQYLKERMGSYMVRHFIKPGITGWAQVNGWRGPTETKLQYMGRTLHDLWYIENWNFWLDIYIIFLTIFSKKAKKNAF